MNHERFEKAPFNRIKNIMAAVFFSQMTAMQELRAQDTAPIQMPSVTFEQQESTLTNLGLREVSKTGAEVYVIVPSTSGKYIVQIDQRHKSSTDSINISKSEKTIAAQEEIGKVIDALLEQKPNVKICPEGVLDTQEYSDEIADYENLFKSFKAASTVEEKFEMFQAWNSHNRVKFDEGYAYELQIAASAMFKSTFSSTITQNIEEKLEALNPFGEHAESLNGIVKRKFHEGKLTAENILPCEDYTIFSKFGEALTNLSNEPESIPYSQEFEKGLQAREQYIVDALGKVLEKDTEKNNYVVVVLGAVHDLSDNILELNTQQEGIGYIRIRTQSVQKTLDEAVAE